MSPDLTREDVASVLGVDENNTGDVIAARSDPLIVSGVVSGVCEKAEFTPGDWVVSIESVTVWRLVDDRAEPVEIDKGPPIDYRDDPSRRWDGPDVTIGVGTGRHREEYKGELILRQPDAVYSPSGVQYYVPMPAGSVSEVVTGGVVSPKTVLKDGERPPSGRGVFAE
jgi:hypothetical protein